MAAKKKIVFVDDEASARKLVTHLLAEAGHEAVACSSWDEAQQLVEAMCPDLVLLDVQMAGVSGVPMAYVLRKKCPELKVVFLSHYPEAVLQQLAEQSGADGFVRKTGDVDELLTSIRAFFDEPAS